MAQKTHISGIFHKRNNSTVVDPKTPVIGIWNLVLEDSNSTVRYCNFNSSGLGCIIASNSNANIINSKFDGKADITPVVGIKNSKIYWDKPKQSTATYPFALGTQDSFFNFPSPNNHGPVQLASLSPITFTTFSGSTINLSNFRLYPRLLNNGSNFFWDKNDLIYPNNIKSYNLDVNQENYLNSLQYLPKNLHRSTLNININDISLTKELTIDGFYNGNVNVRFYNVTVNAKIRFVNIEDLTISTGIITANGSNIKSLLYFDNIKHLEINNVSFNANQVSITNNNANAKPKLPNYFLNLYTYYQNGLWTSCIELKNANAIIHNCKFQNCYCSVVCSVNSIVTGYDNIFNIPSGGYKINGVLFRIICYLSTHNSTVNDSSSKVNNILLSEMNLNNNNKAETAIPIAVMPGSFGNHYHKPLIPTLSDVKTATELNDYPPIGAVFGTINAVNLKYPSSDIIYNGKNYGLHWYNSNNGNKIKVRNYGTYVYNQYYVSLNSEIDSLSVAAINSFKSTNTVIVPNGISINQIPVSTWANKAYENLNLFDAIRFNFDINYHINNTTIVEGSTIPMLFTIPSVFYGNIFSGENILTAVKDCSYNFTDKDITYELSKESTVYPAFTIKDTITRGV